jgi:hypothetical protein
MALISAPGIEPVDRQDGDGKNVAVNPGWRKFFNDVYTTINALVQSGPSANRPDTLLWTGKPFWDETLQQYVYWNGSYWTTATGSGSSSGSSSSIYASYSDTGSSDSEDNFPLPGMVGPQGKQGTQGYSIRGEDGEDGETRILGNPNQVITSWSSFTATRTGWTDVGAPTVTALQCQIERVCYFQVQIVPATTVATVAGTSYISLPLTAAGIGGVATMTNSTTLVAAGTGVIDVANSRVYVPAQVATGNTLTVSGWYNV